MNEQIQLIVSLMGFTYKIRAFISNETLNSTHLYFKDLPISSQIEYLSEEGEIVIDKSKIRIPFDLVAFSSKNYNENLSLKILSKNFIRSDFEKFYKPNFIDSKNTIKYDNLKNSYERNEKDYRPLKADQDIEKSSNIKIDNHNKCYTNDPYIISEDKNIILSISSTELILLRILKFFNCGTYKILFKYSEFEYIPILLQIFFHIPLLFTAVIIFLVILTFDPEINNSLIKNEIGKLPSQKFSKDLEFLDCSVCLEQFIEDDEIRILSCNHCFHKNCIDSWLITSLKCPICRNSVSTFADTYSYEMYQNYYVI